MRSIAGHAMGGAEVFYKDGAWQPGQRDCRTRSAADAKVSAFVFEDDFPLNGEHDAGGGVDVLAPNEPGLGGFNVIIYRQRRPVRRPAGQMTYDMFNSRCRMPWRERSIRHEARCVPDHLRIRGQGFDGGTSPTGITGMITVCPKYEADGTTLSPLAGQAVVRNLPPGRYGVDGHPGADRIARGEEWLQTNTLDGGRPTMRSSRRVSRATSRNSGRPVST